MDRPLVEVRTTDGTIEVNVDRVQILQVLVNLLKNGFESMASAECEFRKAVVGCDIVGPVARLSIQDSGAGVPAEFQNTIFDAFVTTRKEGMGMGLAISRTIVEGHDGRIWLDQNPEAGAVFHVELPLYEASRPSEYADVKCEVDDVADDAAEAVANVAVQEA